MGSYSPITMTKEEARAYIVAIVMTADACVLEDIADKLLKDSLQYLDIREGETNE